LHGHDGTGMTIGITSVGQSYQRLCFTGPACTAIYVLSLHDALPIWASHPMVPEPSALAGGRRHPTSDLRALADVRSVGLDRRIRSEEHTSELQSRFDLVCRLLLEKKKILHMEGQLHRHHRHHRGAWN